MAHHRPGSNQNENCTVSTSSLQPTCPFPVPSLVTQAGLVVCGKKFVEHAKKHGLCELCGETRTHVKVKSGFLRSKLKPITRESQDGSYTVYHGYCLRCYRLRDVKKKLESNKKKNNMTAKKSSRTNTSLPKIPKTISVRSSSSRTINTRRRDEHDEDTIKQRNPQHPLVTVYEESENDDSTIISLQIDSSGNVEAKAVKIDCEGQAKDSKNLHVDNGNLTTEKKTKKNEILQRVDTCRSKTQVQDGTDNKSHSSNSDDSSSSGWVYFNTSSFHDGLNSRNLDLKSVAEEEHGEVKELKNDENYSISMSVRDSTFLNEKVTIYLDHKGQDDSCSEDSHEQLLNTVNAEFCSIEENQSFLQYQSIDEDNEFLDDQTDGNDDHDNHNNDGAEFGCIIQQTFSQETVSTVSPPQSPLRNFSSLENRCSSRPLFQSKARIGKEQDSALSLDKYSDLLKDKAFVHALNAGTLWQTIVGQHIKFPHRWWNGERSPPMGLENDNGASKGSKKVHWRYIARHRVRSNLFLNELVRSRSSPGRILLHIVVRDLITWKPIQDIVVGCFHPNARGIRTTDTPNEKDKNCLDIWMSIRKRQMQQQQQTTTSSSSSSSCSNSCRNKQNDGYSIDSGSSMSHSEEVDHMSFVEDTTSAASQGGDEAGLSIIDPLLTKGQNLNVIANESPLGSRQRVDNTNVRAVFGDKPPLETIFILESELHERLILAERKENDFFSSTLGNEPALMLLQEFVVGRDR